MSEWRLYPEGEMPPVSTVEFHAHRDRAPHLEQPVHRDRLVRAAGFVLDAAAQVLERQANATVSDLGCGDGGLLSLVQDAPRVYAYGYDFAPANEVGWAERGVQAESADVFNGDRSHVAVGDIAVMTEVLEHLADPHEAVRWVGSHAQYLVASSPWAETPDNHDECHSYCWDIEGYRALIQQGGFRILRQEKVSWFQVVLAWRPQSR